MQPSSTTPFIWGRSYSRTSADGGIVGMGAFLAVARLSSASSGGRASSVPCEERQARGRRPLPLGRTVGTGPEGRPARLDQFPPTPRDPGGTHQVIWDELVGEPFEARPPNKPLTVAGYDAGGALTAYVDPIAVSDALPDAALFLAPGWYVNVPLEATCEASWSVTPQPIRDLAPGS